MTHAFEVREEIGLDATPEEVWEAIATGPGIDSWFMGSNELEPREGGRGAMSLLGHTQESTVTAWEPGKRLAYRGDPAPDGRFMAFEYLIGARDGGGTVLRLVHSGLLGDDWEDEYDALSVGDGMYLRKLDVYLRHFAGRTAERNFFLPAPYSGGGERAWAAFGEALGLDGPPVPGAPVRLGVDRDEPVGGVVEFAHAPSFLGVRTADSLYMFVHGHPGVVVVERHSFTGVSNPEVVESAWRSWLDGLTG